MCTKEEVEEAVVVIVVKMHQSEKSSSKYCCKEERDMLAWFAAKVKSVQMICRHFGVSVGSEGGGEKGWDCTLQMQLKHKKRYTFVQKREKLFTTMALAGDMKQSLYRS